MSISNKPNPSRLHVVHLGTSITDTRVRIMQSQEGTANHFKTKVVVRNPVPVSWIQNNVIVPLTCQLRPCGATAYGLSGCKYTRLNSPGPRCNITIISKSIYFVGDLEMNTR